MPEYEVYREIVQITEWRDGAVYRTKSLGYGWFDENEVQANRPRETAILYSVPSSSHPMATQSCIRVKRSK